MLKEFKIKNYRSFRDEQIFSLEVMEGEENLNNNVVELNRDSILKTIAIYGHNSYGKSNLFKGFSKMLQIIKLSSDTNYKIDIENFKLNDFSRNEPTMFEVTIIIDEITYRYGFEVFNELIKKEWLFKDEGEEYTIFERLNSKNDSIILSPDYKNLEKYKEFTRENELFLSSMEKNNITDEIKNICDFLRKKINIISAEDMISQITSKMILNKQIEKEQILEALKRADLGISNFQVKQEEQNFEELPEFFKMILKNNGEKDGNNKIYSTQEEIIHSIYSKNNNEMEGESFDMNSFESEGTKKLYSIIGPILDTINKGSIIFIDELDSKLHHFLVEYIIRLFNDNNNKAQLIFNTHDFYLLKGNIFRKDQIYFVDKDRYGVSNLYSLGDFKGLNKESNIMGHYLLGNFGAIGDIR